MFAAVVRVIDRMKKKNVEARRAPESDAGRAHAAHAADDPAAVHQRSTVT